MTDLPPVAPPSPAAPPPTLPEVARAREAQVAWAATPLTSRLRVVARWSDALEAAKEDLAALMTDEIGKPLRQGVAEVLRAARLVRAALAEVDSTPLDRVAPDGSLVLRRPHGVIAVITPWNNPVAIPVGKLAPALLYGNAAVWKPAPAATRTALAVHALLTRALADATADLSLPTSSHPSARWSELVGLLPGDRDASITLIDDPGVDAVTLSGSPQAGDAVQRAAQRRLLPLQAELGGNNAAIVWDGADLEHTARLIADGALKFAGQRCTANRRAIVQARHFDTFVAHLTRATAELPWGPPEAPATVIGPVVSQASRDRLEALVADAQAAGLPIVRPHTTRPTDPNPSRAYVAPTLVLAPDAAHATHPIVRDEAFGPILVVQRADDEDQALALLDAVPQGLVAALFGGSDTFRARFLTEVRAGTVKLDRPTTDAGVETPFGGWKRSGIGPPEHSVGNREFFSRLQSVVLPPGLAASALRVPTREAFVQSADEVTTHAALEQLTRRLASALSQRFAPGTRLGLVCPLDPLVVATFEAAARTGLVLVPLDPHLPRARLAAIVAAAELSAILTPPSHRTPDLGPQLGPQLDLSALAASDDLAPAAITTPNAVTITPETPWVILFTSGTTGRPKGVIQTRASFAHTARSFIEPLAISTTDRVALPSSLATGQGLATLVTGLLSGATLVAWDLHERGFAGLSDAISTRAISVWMSTPTVFRHAFGALPPGRVLHHLRVVRLGGEAATAADHALFARHAPPRARFAHTLASTETGAYAQLVVGPDARFPAGPLPLGRPVPGRTVTLVDDAGHPVAPGQPGLVAVTSRFLSPGYFADPEATARRFSGTGEARLFLSADRARLREDGQLEHLGRADQAVKIRGARVELGEVEAALATHTSVATAAVLVDDAPEPHLHAFVVARAPLDLAALRADLAAALRADLVAALPGPSVPRLHLVPSLPHTTSGKLDRAALRALATQPDAPQTTQQSTPKPPTDEASQEVRVTLTSSDPTSKLVDALAEAFADTLQVPPAPDLDFFRAGGDSLRAMLLVARLSRELALPITPRDLYVAPTPTALAALIAHRRPPSPTSVMPLVGPEVLAAPRHPTLLCVPGSDAREHLLLGFARLAPLLAPGTPVYGARPLTPLGSRGVTTLTDVAGVLARDLVLASPRGPYLVLGDCLGGALAFEVAHALRRAGEDVAGLVLLDTERPDPARARRIRVHNFPLAPDRDFVRFLGDRARHHLTALSALDWPGRLAYLPNRLAALTRLTTHALQRKPLPSVQARANRDEHPPEVETYLKALMDYVPEPYPGQIDLFLTRGRRPDWSGLARDGVVLHDLPGRHEALFKADLDSTAAALREVFG